MSDVPAPPPPVARSSRNRLRNWIDKGLEARGEPSLSEIVRAARAQDPPAPWYVIAADVTARSGETVTFESLRRWFGLSDTT